MDDGMSQGRRSLAGRVRCSSLHAHQNWRHVQAGYHDHDKDPDHDCDEHDNDSERDSAMMTCPIIG